MKQESSAYARPLAWGLAFVLLLAVAMVSMDGRAGRERAAPGSWWEPVADTSGDGPPLHGVLGAAADEWKATGKYALDTSRLGSQILTVTNVAGLALERLSPMSGDRELRARVRLRTHRAPSASAVFSMAKKDAPSPGLQVSLSTTSPRSPRI